jgi:hypothetical protein
MGIAMKSERACVYVPEDTHHRAKVIAAMLGRSLGWYINKLVVADLEKRERRSEMRTDRRS